MAGGQISVGVEREGRRVLMGWRRFRGADGPGEWGWKHCDGVGVHEDLGGGNSE